jgi:hypothetical protein
MRAMEDVVCECRGSEQRWKGDEALAGSPQHDGAATGSSSSSRRFAWQLFPDADAGRSKINIIDELNPLEDPYPVLVSRSSHLLLVA